VTAQVSHPGWSTLPQNAAYVLLGRLLVPALNVALVVLIARRIGAEALGQYTLLITLFVLFETVKSFGLPALLLREVAREGAPALVYYPALVRIGWFGAVAAAGALVLIGIARGASSAAFPGAAAIMALGLFPSVWALANDALFLALGQARLSTLIAAIENVARLLASLAAVVWFGGGLLALASIYAVTRLLAAVVGRLVIRRGLGLRLPALHPETARAMARQIPHFVGIYVLPILLFRMDVVLLGMLAGDYAVGIYGAAMRVVTIGLVLPDSFLTASFPVLSRLAGTGDGADLARYFRSIVRASSALLTLAAAAGCLLAPFLIRTLYGDAFGPAVPVLQTLLWFAVPYGISRVTGDVLVARGGQGLVARVNLTSLILSVPLYLVLIPLASTSGAAWAFVLSSLLMLAVLVSRALRVVDLIRPIEVGATLTPAGLALLAVMLTRASPGIAESVRIPVVAAVGLVGSTALVLPVWRELWRRDAAASG